MDIATIEGLFVEARNKDESYGLNSVLSLIK